ENGALRSVSPLSGARVGFGFGSRLCCRIAQCHRPIPPRRQDDPAVGGAVIADTPVRVDRDGPVAIVTLSRPGKANAMDGEITEALLAALGSLSTRGDVGAMVLTGHGAAFSAGGDVETIKEMGRDRMCRDAILGAHQRLFHTMTRLPFASVAAVNGAAVGAGATAALLCDLVVMADTAF